MRAAGYDLGSSLGFVINLGGIVGMLVGGRLVGWTSGRGGFGAVFGPRLGGQLLATGSTTAGFTVFAAAGVFSLVFIGPTGLPSLKGSTGKDTARRSPRRTARGSASGNDRGQVLNLGPGL